MFGTPSTTQLYSSPASCRQSFSAWSNLFPIETGDSCPVNQYYYSGFVALQALLDYTKIRVSQHELNFTIILLDIEWKNGGGVNRYIQESADVLSSQYLSTLWEEHK